MRRRLYDFILAYLLVVLTLGPVPAFSGGTQVDFLLSQVRSAAQGLLSSGKVYFYQAGTTTLKNIYTNVACTNAAANPYTLDANGTALLYGNGTYRVVIKTSADVTVYDRDNVRLEDFLGGFTGDGTGNISGFDNITAVTRVRAPNIGASSFTDNGYFNFITGGGTTPRISGFSFGASGYTDNGYFSDVITKGPWRDVRADGADPTGAADSRAAFQAAIDNVEAVGGGVVYIPTGTYLFSTSNSTDNCILKITKPVQFIGAGMLNTILKPAASIGASIDFIKIVPTTPIEGLRLADFRIVPVSGTPARHAIHIDGTGYDAHVGKSLIERVYLSQLGGRGIATTNNTGYANGVWFTAVVRDSVIYGGVYLNGAGDSIDIEANTITGTGWGVEVNLVSGALVTNINRNNITSVSGAVKVSQGRVINILGNTIENNTTTDVSDNVSIHFAGNVTNLIRGGLIAYNSMGSTGVEDGIKIDYAQKVGVRNNTFTAGFAATNFVVTTANAVDTDIGPNWISSGMTSIYSNAGLRTRGIHIAPTLLNGWVDNTGTTTVAYMRDAANTVHLFGSISNGTATAGTIVFQLPDGYRPNGTARFPVWALDNVPSNKSVWVQINQDGEVSLLGTDASYTDIGLDGISFRVTPETVY